MNQANKPSWSGPTAGQLAEHIQRHAPRGLPWWSTWLPLLLLVLAGVLAMVVAGPWGAALPWLLMGGVFILLLQRGQLARRLERNTISLQELAMLRNFAQALRKSWLLLPRLVVNPMLHLRAVTVIAHCLDQLKAFDAAIVGYDYLVEHLPPEHPTALQAKAQRAIASLCADHLVDGDDTLRQLRQPMAQLADTPVAATYRLGQLVQNVRTGHYTDAIADSEQLCAQLRPLGVDAGYGHALMALCYYHGRLDDQNAARASASRWWQTARMLLPGSVMVDRFPELAVLGEIS